jgi:hypothetical protein
VERANASFLFRALAVTICYVVWRLVILKESWACNNLFNALLTVLVF